MACRCDDCKPYWSQVEIPTFFFFFFTNFYKNSYIRIHIIRHFYTNSYIRIRIIRHFLYKLYRSNSYNSYLFLWKNSPHTPTFSFLVSPCTYYFDHFSCTSSDSICTIDIPPRLRNLHNQFLYAILFKLLLFLYLSRFFCEIR